MPYEIVTGAFCQSSYGVYEVPGSKPGTSYRVSQMMMQGAHCPCKAYEFSAWPKRCKHIDYAYKNSCQWNEQWSEGHPNATLKPIDYTYDQVIPGKVCPVCGGPCVAVKIAV